MMSAGPWEVSQQAGYLSNSLYRHSNTLSTDISWLQKYPDYRNFNIGFDCDSFADNNIGLVRTKKKKKWTNLSHQGWYVHSQASFQVTNLQMSHTSNAGVSKLRTVALLCYFLPWWCYFLIFGDEGCRVTHGATAAVTCATAKSSSDTPEMCT